MSRRCLIHFIYIYQPIIYHLCPSWEGIVATELRKRFKKVSRFYAEIFSKVSCYLSVIHKLCSISYFLRVILIFPVAQMVKNLPAIQETQVWSPGWKDLLEKGMAIHSSILAWRIPWIKEPGRPQSMGLQRVGHAWATNTTLGEPRAIYWRRQWYPTPVLLPRKSHGRRSLVGCSPWGR